jgi:hypothetical protein
MGCFTPKLKKVPIGDWVCPQCMQYTCFIVLCETTLLGHKYNIDLDCGWYGEDCNSVKYKGLCLGA